MYTPRGLKTFVRSSTLTIMALGFFCTETITAESKKLTYCFEVCTGKDHERDGDNSHWLCDKFKKIYSRTLRFQGFNQLCTFSKMQPAVTDAIMQIMDIHFKPHLVKANNLIKIELNQ